jgi:tripartite-type tricarboxylate transporter receptor subunit TctC
MWGIWALGPAGMPRAAVQRLNAAINKAAVDPPTRAKLEGRGQIVGAYSPDQFAGVFLKANELAAAMAKRSGIKPE